MAIFRLKPCVNPFGKMSMFRLFKVVVFYSLEKRFFVPDYRKRLFSGLNCIKKKLEKWPFFALKPWVNPFWKNVNISTFKTSCFYTLERRVFRSRIS